MTGPRSAELPRFSTQLLDAYLYEATVSRREKKAEDGAQPVLNATMAAPEVSPDSTSFSQLIGVTVAVPFNEGAAILEMKCVYNGVFASSLGPMTPDQIKEMASRTTTVLLWPYLRAGVAQLGQMTAVPIPQIPTLDVATFMATAAEAAPKPRPTSPRRRKNQTTATK